MIPGHTGSWWSYLIPAGCTHHKWSLAITLGHHKLQGPAGPAFCDWWGPGPSQNHASCFLFIVLDDCKVIKEPGALKRLHFCDGPGQSPSRFRRLCQQHSLWWILLLFMFEILMAHTIHWKYHKVKTTDRASFSFLVSFLCNFDCLQKWHTTLPNPTRNSIHFLVPGLVPKQCQHFSWQPLPPKPH